MPSAILVDQASTSVWLGQLAETSLVDDVSVSLRLAQSILIERPNCHVISSVRDLLKDLCAVGFSDGRVITFLFHSCVPIALYWVFSIQIHTYLVYRICVQKPEYEV